MSSMADDLDRPGLEGAAYICSPPLRDAATQEVLWRHVQTGTLQLVSSDHAPYRMDASGKFHAGNDPTFKQIANGMPGIEMRLPLLFSEGVTGGRITLNRFVELSSTNAAKIYGLHPALQRPRPRLLAVPMSLLRRLARPTAALRRRRDRR